MDWFDEWEAKINFLRELFKLKNEGVITGIEYNDLKFMVLKHDDEQIIDQYEKSKDESSDSKGRPQGSNTVDSCVERDGILDGLVTNAPVKKFKDDFERINVGDSPAADYY